MLWPKNGNGVHSFNDNMKMSSRIELRPSFLESPAQKTEEESNFIKIEEIFFWVTRLIFSCFLMGNHVLKYLHTMVPPSHFFKILHFRFLASPSLQAAESKRFEYYTLLHTILVNFYVKVLRI